MNTDKFLESLQVSLSIELGAVELSAEQLLSMTPDSLIPIGEDVYKEDCRLRLGEEVVATGQLKNRDGELVFEVQQLGLGEESEKKTHLEKTND